MPGPPVSAPARIVVGDRSGRKIVAGSALSMSDGQRPATAVATGITVD